MSEVIELIRTNGPESADIQKPDRGKIKNFEFTEAEVNELLARWIKDQKSGAGADATSIKSAVVRLKNKRVVQLDAVAALSPKMIQKLGPEENSLIGKTLKKCVGFDNSIYLEGILSSAKGTAFIKVSKLKIKGVPFPDAAVQKVVKLIGESQDPPVDLSKPFPLPNGIEKIDVQPGTLGLRIKVL